MPPRDTKSEENLGKTHSLRGPTFSRWVMAVLVLALVARLGFLALGNVLPVMWDARRYAAAAVGLLSLLDRSHARPVSSEEADQDRFAQYADKYIQGEQIEWLGYTPHTLTEAREELFFSGPLYPAALAVIFVLAPAHDFTFARLFGILLELLGCLLLIRVAERLVGRTAALIAGVGYAVYFPFILSGSMLLLETSTNFWILLALHLLLRATETDRRRPLVLAGIVAGLLVLNKPTAMLLVIPLAIGFALYTYRRWPVALILSRLGSFAAPMAIIFMGWLAITSAHYGRLSLRDPAYASANLRQSTSIEYEGYDLDVVDKDFWTRSITSDIIGNPIGFAGLLIKKFDRMWRRPFNDFELDFVAPHVVHEVFHLVVVLLGLCGLLALARSDLSRAGWPLAIVGYYTLVHLIFHSVSRYNLNAVPMVLLAAGFSVSRLWHASRSAPKGTRLRIVLGILLVVAALCFSDDRVNAAFNTGLTQTLVVLVLILKTVLLGAGLLLAIRAIDGLVRFKMILWQAGAAGLVIAAVLWSMTLSRDRWAEFACRLSTPEMKAGTRLYISDFSPVPSDELLAVVIDLNSGRGRSNTFTVFMGDSSREFVGARPPLLEYFYLKWSYDVYAAIKSMGLEEYRQFVYIPVNDSLIPRLLERDGFIDIEVAVNNRFPEPNNYVTVWGSFETGTERRFIPAPRFTSIERYIHLKDPRIPYPVKYLSDSTISYYIRRSERAAAAGADLSPSAGRQSGRFNIFLTRFRSDGSFLVY